jgi:hypothetical protein
MIVVLEWESLFPFPFSISYGKHFLPCLIIVYGGEFSRPLLEYRFPFLKIVLKFFVREQFAFRVAEKS